MTWERLTGAEGVPLAFRTRPFGDEPRIEVIAVDLNPDGGVLAWALARAGVLTSDERRRATRFTDPAAGRAWIAARVVVRHVLGARSGLRPGDLRILRRGAGRPHLPAHDPAFSVARSDRSVFLALAPSGFDLGIDAETTLSAAAGREITPLLHAQEVATLARLTDDEFRAAITRTWTRKEAYLKALGTGLRRDPSCDHVGADGTPALPADAPTGTRIVDLPQAPGLADLAAICVILRNEDGSGPGGRDPHPLRWQA